MGEAKRRTDLSNKMEEAIEKWKEVNPPMELKVIFTGSATLIGELKGDFSCRILCRPRAVAVGQDAQGRGVIALQQLVGEPEEVEVGNYSLMYGVKDEKVINLYIQATTGIIPASNLNNVRPIKGGGGNGGRLA